MASSNPFRRSMVATSTSTTTSLSAAARFPPLDNIDTSSSPSPSFPELSVTEKKSKVVKKVRVLSPPPLSPDSPEWPFVAPPLSAGLLQPDENDPFDAPSADDSDHEIIATVAPPPPKDGSRAPANPFSKTLRDMETVSPDQKLMKERRDEGSTLKTANTARRSLDVNSFKRLLMTGNLGADAPTQQSRLAPQRGGADSSSISLSSSNYDGSKDGLTAENEAQEISLISRDTSDTPDDDLDQGALSDSSNSAQMSRGKKPPPPPSSRHGKSIKLEFNSNGSSPSVLSPKSPSDVNKPLPLAPLQGNFEDEDESPFDRESVGKVPDIDVQSAQSPPSSVKKAVPAPPPRRGHARGESKANIPKPYDDKTPSRSSSMRSKPQHSRSDSHAPVPRPPPPRSHGGSKSTVTALDVAAAIGGPVNLSYPSSQLHPGLDKPVAHTPTSSVEPSPPRISQSGNYKIAAPPPPPTRNISVRRPASVRSVDSSSRRASTETKPHNSNAPPPPPRRQRGSSRGSMDGPYRRTSLDEVPRTGHRLPGEDNHPDVVIGSTQSSAEEGKGIDILADLNALQREVDALRGKMGS